MKAERSDQASNKSDNVSNTETDIGFGEELISRGSWNNRDLFKFCYAIASL